MLMNLYPSLPVKFREVNDRTLPELYVSSCLACHNHILASVSPLLSTGLTQEDMKLSQYD